MLRITMLVAALGLATTACSGEELPGKRETFAKGRFAIQVPDGWTTEREPGAVVFVGDEASALDRNTIAVRSVAREGDWVVERTAELVVPATAKALAALPGAEVTPATSLKVGDLVGAVFDVTYEPVAGNGERYARRHAVLVGRDRVFHLIHTAPVADLARTAASFDIAVKSLREEG